MTDDQSECEELRDPSISQDVDLHDVCGRYATALTRIPVQRLLSARLDFRYQRKQPELPISASTGTCADRINNLATVADFRVGDIALLGQWRAYQHGA
jgi:hypothetical protein